jgi:HPt (histidine-containing phosphotransfer) domain-containing protein
MAELFVEHSGEDLDFIQEAAAVGDLAALGSRAHRLKGGSYAFGAQRLGDKAAELERQAKAGVPDADPLIEELLVLFRETRRALESERSAHGESSP